MSIHITDACILCAACQPECPNDAIREGDRAFVIAPARCTECVGFHDEEACQAVCPVECCLPDPKRRETEEVLYARAVKLHPEKKFPPLEDLPPELSHFRRGKPVKPKTPASRTRSWRPSVPRLGSALVAAGLLLVIRRRDLLASERRGAAGRR